MGLLDELLRDAHRALGIEEGGGLPAISTQRKNLDHVVDTASRVLTEHFRGVLRGRSIRLRPEYDANRRIWTLAAELTVSIPFTMNVTEEVLHGKPGAGELTLLATREAGKLANAIVADLTRQLNGHPAPTPKPPSPVRDFDVMAPDLQRPLLTFREWMVASSNQRVYASGHELRQLYDRYMGDWYSQNDGAAKDEVVDAITKANRLAELDEEPIPDIPFGKEAD